jgi:hypothetical protein
MTNYILPNGDKLIEPKVPAHVLKAFEDKYHRNFDLSPFDGTWGNGDRYKHPHIQSLWEGWRDSYLALASRPACTAEVVVPDSVVGAAMKEAWDDICSDTGHHPDDITHEGRLLYYDPGHWSNLVAKHINAALASPPSPAQSAIFPPVVEVTEGQIRALVLKHFTQTRHRLTYEDEKDGISITRVSGDMEAFCRDLIAAALQAQHMGG